MKTHNKTSILLCAILLVSLSGCGGSDDNVAAPTTNTDNQTPDITDPETPIVMPEQASSYRLKREIRETAVNVSGTNLPDTINSTIVNTYNNKGLIIESNITNSNEGDVRNVFQWSDNENRLTENEYVDGELNKTTQYLDSSFFQSSDSNETNYQVTGNQIQGIPENLNNTSGPVETQTRFTTWTPTSYSFETTKRQEFNSFTSSSRTTEEVTTELNNQNNIISAQSTITTNTSISKADTTIEYNNQNQPLRINIDIAKEDNLNSDLEPLNSTQTFTYNENGQLTATNQMSSDGIESTSTFTYSTNGLPETRTINFVNGEITSTFTTRFEWEAGVCSKNNLFFYDLATSQWQKINAQKETVSAISQSYDESAYPFIMQTTCAYE